MLMWVTMLFCIKISAATDWKNELTASQGSPGNSLRSGSSISWRHWLQRAGGDAFWDVVVTAAGFESLSADLGVIISSSRLRLSSWSSDSAPVSGLLSLDDCVTDFRFDWLQQSFCEKVKDVALPSVLWRCWLSGTKGIRPVRVVGC